MTSAGRLALWAVAVLAGAAPAQDPAPPAAAPVPAGEYADRPGVFAGAGLYLIQPRFQNNLAYTVFQQTTVDPTLNTDNPTTQTIGESARRVEVRHTLAAAPLLWLGYMNEDGLGVRARWWGFQEGTSQTASLLPFAGPFKVGQSNGEMVVVNSGKLVTVTSAAPLGLQAFGDTLSIKYGPEAVNFTVTTKLLVQVADLEVIQRFRDTSWDVLVSGGVRIARLDQAYNAYDAQSGSPIELRTLASTYNFRGVGPTMALEARRSLGCRGISAYGLCRGSLVIGSAEQEASFSGQELRNNDPNPQLASQRRDRAIPIIDIGTGVEYGRAVGGTWVFGRVGVVGQQWFNAGGASRSSTLNVAGTLRPVLGGAAVDSNLSFVGLTLQMGVDY